MSYLVILVSQWPLDMIFLPELYRGVSTLKPLESRRLLDAFLSGHRRGPNSLGLRPFGLADVSSLRTAEAIDFCGHLTAGSQRVLLQRKPPPGVFWGNMLQSQNHDIITWFSDT